MFLKDEVLEKLKCDYCFNYLSCSPVLLSNTGKNMCGRCSPTTYTSEMFYENRAYEDLATIVIFPCKNNKNGCNSVVKLTNAQNHEEHCVYDQVNSSYEETITCPSGVTERDCDWNGELEDIKEHFHEKHSQLIFDSPYCDKLSLKKDFSKNVILEVFEFLFLVRIKCLISMGYLWQDVLFLGPKLEYGHIFSYTLQLYNDESCLKENKDVTMYNDDGWKLKKGDATVNNIKHLQKLLNTFTEINFKISITLKYNKCSYCSTILQTIPIIAGNIISCKKCYEQSELLKCKNSEKGCDYKILLTGDGSLRRHYTWFCNFNNFYCSSCVLNIDNTNQFNHMLKSHTYEVHPTRINNMSLVTIIYIPRKWRINSGSFFYSTLIDGTTFVFEISFTDDTIFIWLIANTDDFSYKYFKCTYEFLNVVAKGGILLKKLDNDLGKYDWFSKVKILGPIPNEIKINFFLIKKINNH